MKYFLLALSAFATVRQGTCSPDSAQPQITQPPLVERGDIRVVDGSSTRWIGVDTDALTPANIEGHTNYLTEESGTQKWVAENQDSLTEVATITSTKDDQVFTTEVPAPGASVSVDESGSKLTFLLPPKVVNGFTKAIEGACGAAAAKIKKRSGSCAYQVLENLPDAGELNIPLDSITVIDKWIANGGFANLLELHGITLEAFTAIAKSQAAQRYYALALAATTIWTIKGSLPHLNDLDLSKGVDPTTTRTEGPTTTQTSATTTSSGACPTDGLSCDNEKCKGDAAEGKCAQENEYKDCDCIGSGTEIVNLNTDPEWHESLQQEVLESYNNGEAEDANLDDTVSCNPPNDGDPFAGRGNLEPMIKEFCKNNDHKLLTESESRFEKKNTFGSPDEMATDYYIRADYSTDVGDRECPSDGNRQITETNCYESLKKVLDCSTDGVAPADDQKRFGGSTIGENCVVYKIDLEWLEVIS